MDIINFIWLFFLLSSLTPVVQQHYLAAQRVRALRALEKRNGSRAITMIHRRETFSFLGIPFAGFIDIDDSEAIIRAIEMTSNDLPIDMVLHTPGGLVLAAEQIASALAAHPGPITVYVPHYAMSGGTLIALAADEIVVDAHTALGPVDPQLGQYPAASLVEVAQRPGDHDDQTLIMADVARKALAQVEGFTTRLLERHMPPERAREAAHLLASGVWTHDHPLQASELLALGLPARIGVPELERQLMTLYPQPRGRTPAVEYVPASPTPALPGRREIPRTARRH
jgi:ClpP class serine protease